MRPAAQSAGSAQLVLHALLPSQANDPQDVTCGVHWWAASQVNTVSVDAEQVVGMQVVPAGYVAHCPAPSQLPVVMQVDAGRLMQSPLGSSPTGTGWQVPCLLATAHEVQGPQVTDAQQKPSVQLPLKHSVPATQAAPLAFRLVQTLAMQVKPLAQSPSPAQVVRQAAPPQENGAQLTGACTQAPAPLQLPTGVNVDPLHDAVPQLVVGGPLRQAPLPSHRPLNPHGGFGAQPPCGSISSTPTGLHIPAMPATLHDWQLPHTADEQQTPSTQLPLSHSLGPAHSWPRRFNPQEPSLQTLPGAQSPSPPQAALQVVPLQA